MSNREACAAYFKEQKEYRRIFAVMKKKWESLGKTAGKAVLPAASGEERAALARFLGRPMTEEPLSFSLAAFERALQETKYGDVSLKELLEAYFGEPLVGSREKRLQKKDREQEFWQGLERELEERGASCGESLAWIRELREKKSGGYAVVRREYGRSEEGAKKLVLQAAESLRLCGPGGIQEAAGAGNESAGKSVPERPEMRLAVLAAKATGNPHALDRQTTVGTLFTYGLCRRCESGFPRNAREWKELYERNGILVDELSHTVIAYGLTLLTGQGPHPAYEGYRRQKEPCVISLANLRKIESAHGETKRIYIVENEMVFSELLERVLPGPATILCTSGQPRTAAYRLLELLAAGGARLFYAGDLDPEGLGIADRIWQSFPDHVRIWRMGEEDYEKARSQEPISKRRLEGLKGLTHPQLRRTAGRILACGRAGYQELLLEDMAEDILRGQAEQEESL